MGGGRLAKECTAAFCVGSFGHLGHAGRTGLPCSCFAAIVEYLPVFFLFMFFVAFNGGGMTLYSIRVAGLLRRGY